ncbi:MAG: hypothetical protein FJ312_10055 [SAR202 cluster bacterium]|nr:hypothetical protein [SAR202 cluster bacterium]
MPKSKMSGKIQTVLGPIEPEKLGITHTHEHLLIDLACYFQVPDAASERVLINAPLTMDRLGNIYAKWNYNWDSMQLLDVATAIEQVSRFKYAGGSSIVDTTSIGIARDPLALQRISRATGLNIIMGASHYVPLSHPTDMDKRSEQSIADHIVRDVTVGVGETGVRSGLIGEIGNFWPMSANERKVLLASAHAAQETGAAILIHPGFHADSPPAILDVLIKAGLKPERIVMGHLDVFHDLKWFERLAATGCYMEWDTFGMEDTHRPSVVTETFQRSSDVQRMQKLEYLIERGYGNRLVIAHDVCFKFRYSHYGGKTYDHILTNIVPRMRKRGFTEKHINDILVENPKRVLTFV